MACAELSVGFPKIGEVDAVLADADFALEQTLREALFLAGKACQRYRAGGGVHTGAVPDFRIRTRAAVDPGCAAFPGNISQVPI